MLFRSLAGKIKEYLEILGSRERILGIISDELREKGLPGADERWKGQQMEEILYKQFVDSGGLLGYGDSDGS